MLECGLGRGAEDAHEYLNTNGALGDPDPPPAGAPGPNPSGTAYVAFAYDALGRRIEKIVDSGGAQVEVTRYYYDGQNVVLETDADEAPRRTFVHGSQYIDERVLMRLPSGTEYYYLPRELYSVAALTDETGSIVEACTYDAYGKVAMYDQSATGIPQSEIGNVYYFTGRRLDLLPLASGLKQLYHYRARAYDPGNGRFMQRDPAEYVDGANLYAYVRSSPASMRDPAGLMCGYPPMVPPSFVWNPTNHPKKIGTSGCITSFFEGTTCNSATVCIGKYEGDPCQLTIRITPVQVVTKNGHCKSVGDCLFARKSTCLGCQ